MDFLCNYIYPQGVSSLAGIDSQWAEVPLQCHITTNGSGSFLVITHECCVMIIYVSFMLFLFAVVATSVTLYVLVSCSVHHNIQTVYHHSDASPMLRDGGTCRRLDSLSLQGFTQTGEQEKCVRVNKNFCGSASHLIWPLPPSFLMANFWPGFLARYFLFCDYKEHNICCEFIRKSHY